MNCQWKLSGGLVVDGTGASAYRADVAVGDLADVEAEHIIDCSDRVVTPGFIDIHSHSDFLMPGTDASALVEPFLRQGMSTLVGGNCGFSPAPLTEKNHSVTRESSRLIIDDEIDLRWETMDGFLSALDEGGVPLNVAELVGHEAVRAAVMGHLDSSVPDEQQLDSMERLVREALDAGVGVSTGLGYPPAISAEHDELARVAGWAAAAGLDVAFDAFPYTAGNTTASVLFPPEMLPHLETILEPPEQLEGLKTLGAQLFAQNGFYLEDIQIMRANATRFDELNGLFVGEAAKRVGMDVWEFYARLVVESHRNARVLSTYVDVGLFEFEEAVRKMTGAPAERLGWSDRGFVRDGCAADLVVLDRAQLRDRATFESPARFPTGIEKVFVGGVLVVDGDRYDASALAGQVLRS